MKKRSIIIISFIVFALFLIVKEYKEEDIILGDSVVMGDVDGDNKVKTNDYILIRKHLLKTPELTGDKLKKADVNKDGKISVSDYIVVRKIILGLYSPTSTATPKPTSTPTIPSMSKMHFLKTGDSDAIVIESNGHYGLVDAGLSGGAPISYLRSLGVKYLDFVILTHSHPDHYGGMIDVANTYVNSNTTFYYRKASGQIPEDQQYYSTQTKIIDTMKNCGAKMEEVTNRYPKFSLGDFTFELMNTEQANSDEKNPQGLIAGMNKESIVTYVLYKNSIGTLLTGDVESQDEYRLASKLASKKVDVLKVAHHSWQSSTTFKFTKAIRPKIAVVTGNYLLDDISTPTYYMQKTYGTKFYVTGKSDNGVVIDYSSNLSVSPSKALQADYKITESTGNWRKLQNGIWFYLDNVNDLSSIVYNDWRLSGGKWYYMGLQGNMMTGWVEVKYKDKPCLFYLDTNGAMLTGFQQAKSISPYNNKLSSYYSSWMYSHENGTVDAWYQYSSTWANGKNKFYFDPATGVMQSNKTLNIGGRSYTFNGSGICIKGC